MRLSARGDYAVRAAVELAAVEPRMLKVHEIASAQGMPVRFLENILLSLRHTGLVESRRGADGGFKLARAADEITLADVVRACEGPLAAVQGERPEQLNYEGSAEPLRDVWVAVRAALRDVLEHVTVADVAAARLPSAISSRTSGPGAWDPH